MNSDANVKPLSVSPGGIPLFKTTSGSGTPMQSAAAATAKSNLALSNLIKVAGGKRRKNVRGGKLITLPHMPHGAPDPNAGTSSGIANQGLSTMITTLKMNSNAVGDSAVQPPPPPTPVGGKKRNSKRTQKSRRKTKKITRKTRKTRKTRETRRK